MKWYFITGQIWLRYWSFLPCITVSAVVTSVVKASGYIRFQLSSCYCMLSMLRYTANIISMHCCNYCNTHWSVQFIALWYSSSYLPKSLTHSQKGLVLLCCKTRWRKARSGPKQGRDLVFGGWTISPYCPNNNTHTWIPPTGNTKCVLHLMKSFFMLKKYVHVIWMYSICHVVIVMWCIIAFGHTTYVYTETKTQIWLWLRQYSD